LLIAIPIASDGRHPNTAAVYFPEQITDGFVHFHHGRLMNARRSRIGPQCTSLAITLKIRPREPPKETRIEFRFRAVNGWTYPALLAHVPHGRNSFFIACTDPRHGFGKAPIRLPVPVAHRSTKCGISRKKYHNNWGWTTVDRNARRAIERRLMLGVTAGDQSHEFERLASISKPTWS
jgi:hypothetical protein